MKSAWINEEWHKSHRMPKNPTMDQRIEWHMEHLKHCRCRSDIPEGIKLELKKRGLAIPKPGFQADDKHIIL